MTTVAFHDQPYDGTDFTLAHGTQFVVRVPDNHGGYEIQYQKLSVEQEHERVDSWIVNTQGCSLDYASYDEGTGCYSVLELYNFRWGCC